MSEQFWHSARRLHVEAVDRVGVPAVARNPARIRPPAARAAKPATGRVRRTRPPRTVANPSGVFSSGICGPPVWFIVGTRLSVTPAREAGWWAWARRNRDEDGIAVENPRESDLDLQLCQRGAPRQRCRPKPRPRWRSRAATGRIQPCSKTSGSRFAAATTTTTRPAVMNRPSRQRSTVDVRPTAVAVRPDGGIRRRRRASPHRSGRPDGFHRPQPAGEPAHCPTNLRSSRGPRSPVEPHWRPLVQRQLSICGEQAQEVVPGVSRRDAARGTPRQGRSSPRVSRPSAPAPITPSNSRTSSSARSHTDGSSPGRAPAIRRSPRRGTGGRWSS